MSDVVSERTRWQETLRRQSLDNARYWLEQIEGAADGADLVVTDYDNLLHAVETTLRDEESFDLAFRLLQALYTTAYHQADWDRWLVYLQQALEMSRSLRRAQEAGRCSEQIGDLLAKKGDLRRAEQHLRKALELYESVGEQDSRARVMTKLAGQCAVQGRLKEGIELCRAVLEGRDTHNPAVLAHAYISLSQLHAQAQEWQEALASAQTAYEHYRALSNRPWMVTALANIVNCWIGLQAWDHANEAAATLSEHVVTHEDVHVLMKLKLSLGGIAFKQRNYLAAEASWQEVLRLNSQVEEPEYRAAVHNNLGMVYTRMGEWEAAGAMLRQAATEYLEFGNTYKWANTLDNLAELYEAQGDFEACRSTLQEAVEALGAAAGSEHGRRLLASMQSRLAALPQISA